MGTQIRWKSVLWSGILIALLPMVTIFLITLAYGTYVGFQTRGNMDLVNQRIAGLDESLLFTLAVHHTLPTLVAFWRGRVFARHLGGQATMNAILAAIVGLAFHIGLDILRGALDSLPLTVLLIVMVLGGSYLSTRLIRSISAASAT